MSNSQPQFTQAGPDAKSGSILRRAVRNAVFNGIGTILTFILSFAFAGLTIRYLGESRGGYFMTLQALLGLNFLLLGAGLGTPAVRRLAILYGQNNLLAARSVVGAVVVVNIATTLPIAVLIIIFFSPIFDWTRLDAIYFAEAYSATLLVCASFMVGQISSSWQTVYQAFQRYDLINVLNTVFGFLSGVAGIVALQIMPTMTTVALVGLGVVILRLVCDAYLMRRLLGSVPLIAWPWNEIRPMLKFGGWTYLGTVGAFLFTNIDRLILTTFLGSAALPYYVVPQRLYSQVHSTLVSQTAFLFPMFSAFGESAAQEIARLEDRLRWFIALVSAAVYTGLGLSGTFIIAKLVNSDFAARATAPLILACVQGFLNAQNIYPYFSSWAVGKGAPNAVAQIVNGVLVSVTAIVLIPRLGYLGASIAQLWIGVTVIWHTLWVRRSIATTVGRWNWLRPYISPICMSAVWISTMWLSAKFVPGDSIGFFVWVAIGGGESLAIVWLIEHWFFAVDQRWATLTRAMRIPLSKIENLLPFRKISM